MCVCVCVGIIRVQPLTPIYEAEVERLRTQAAATPKPPAWGSFCSEVPELGRKIWVAQCCSGVDAGDAEHALGLQIEAVNVYDIEARYEDAMKELMLLYHNSSSTMHFGPKQGDMCLVPLQNLVGDVHLLKGGPPCPPWAGNGSKKGQADARAHVFIQALRWLIFFLAKHGLVAVLLENVRGVLQCIDGMTPFFELVLNMLRSLIPEFNWRHDTMQAEDYKLPQQRCRVLLRGLDKRCCPDMVPPPLPPFGSGDLRNFLALGLENTNLSKLTKGMKNNLVWFQRQVKP